MLLVMRQMIAHTSTKAEKGRTARTNVYTDAMDCPQRVCRVLAGANSTRQTLSHFAVEHDCVVEAYQYIRRLYK